MDAVCINQADTQERAQQVSMIADIYENAAEVCVWLGPDASDNIRAVMKRCKPWWSEIAMKFGTMFL